MDYQTAIVDTEDGDLRGIRADGSVRQDELNKIRALVEPGNEGCLIVVGESGSGKTRLLGAVGEIPRTVVRRVRANPAEASLPYSGLSAILAAFQFSEAAALADRLVSQRDEHARSAVHASAILTLFHDLDAPAVLLLIDDLDLMDRYSQTVVGMVATRSSGSRLRLVGTVSSQVAEGPLASLPQIKLAPLDFAASMRLLTHLGGASIDESVARMIVTAANGNPAALVHSLRTLTAKARKGITPIALPFRTSVDSNEATLNRELGPDSEDRRALLTRLSCSRLTSYGAVTLGSGVIAHALEDLLSEGIVVRSGAYLRIRDPLLRSRVYWSLSAASRAVFHTTAAIAEEKLEPRLAVWHRSWLDLDPISSDELLIAATGFARDGFVVQALELAERALTLDRGLRDHPEALFDFAGAAFLAGELVHARRYVRILQHRDAAGSVPAKTMALRAAIEFASAEQVLVTDSDHRAILHEGDDPDEAAQSLADIAIYHTERWEFDEARDSLERAMALQTGTTRRTNDRIALARMMLAALRGEPDLALAMFDQVTHRDLADLAAADLIVLGRALTLIDRHSLARRALKTALGIEPEVLWAETAKYAMAENEILSGNQFEAMAIIDQLPSPEDGSQIYLTTHLLLMSWYWQTRGEPAESAAAIARCEKALAAAENPAVNVRFGAYQGRFALMRGELDEAIVFLQRTAVLTASLDTPILLPYLVDLIEAYVLASRLTDAMSQFQDFRKRAARYNMRWITLTTARAAALVASGDESLAAFRQAIRLWRPGDSQFERARTLLSYGDRLASLGRVHESREQYLAARMIFTQLGATLWAKHASTARTEQQPSREHPLLALLTTEERHVADMVCQGLRNKEIAAELFVSLRTVEVRLTKIYQKLNARSRAHLTALLSGGESPSTGRGASRNLRAHLPTGSAD